MANNYWYCLNLFFECSW